MKYGRVEITFSIFLGISITDRHIKFGEDGLIFFQRVDNFYKLRQRYRSHRMMFEVRGLWIVCKVGNREGINTVRNEWVEITYFNISWNSTDRSSYKIRRGQTDFFPTC